MNQIVTDILNPNGPDKTEIGRRERGRPRSALVDLAVEWLGQPHPTTGKPISFTVAAELAGVGRRSVARRAAERKRQGTTLGG